jgi:hypothetical protein
LIEAIRRFRAREVGEAEVVEAVRVSRLLIPLVAELGESGRSESGHLVDKSQELSIVTVKGPDGRNVLPVFSSVSSMSAWNPLARPVPAAGPRVALAAASEETDLVVIDPTSETQFAIRRPALWALAQGEPWIPSYLDTGVLDAFLEAAEPEESVMAVQLAPGDPSARLDSAELLVQLSLVGGLDESQLSALIARLQQRWAVSETIASRVDSLAVRITAV